MRSISRILDLLRPNDEITPQTAYTVYRPAGQYGQDDQLIPFSDLPPENPNLLRAFPYPVDEYGGRHRRPSCLILGASRAEHEHMRQLAAAADAIAYELAVAEAMLILYPDRADAAAVSDVLHVALPLVADRPAPQLAVTR